MRLNLTVVDGRNERAVDALLDFDPARPVAEVVPAALALLGEQVHESFVGRIPVWVDGTEVGGETPAGEAGVRTGAVLALFEHGRNGGRAAPAGLAELRVVSGPGAGRVHRLALGDTTVGCGAAGWSLSDLMLPTNALTVHASPRGEVSVTVADGVAGTLDDEPVEGTVEWPDGGYLRVGSTVLSLAVEDTPTADVTVDPDEGVVDFNRPPRMLPPEGERGFSLPDKPSKPTRRPLPWVMVIAPLMISLPMALITGRMMYMLFGLMSPLMALANFISDRKTSRKENVLANRQYDEQLAVVRERIAKALVEEQAERRRSSPDPATLLHEAIGPGRRLWERRVGDPDYLRVRVGLAGLPAEVTVEEKRDKTEERAEPPTLADVPAWVDLAGSGVVGVAGDSDTALPTAQWMVAQLATLHSPLDVRLVLLTDAEGEDAWSWVRWLPHAREGETLLVGTQQDSIGRRLGELSNLIDQRAAADDRGRPAPDVVVVLDGARRLRSLPAVVDLLRRGPGVGVWAICVDDEARQLPGECRVVVACETGRVRVHETAATDIDDVTPDLVEPAWLTTVARALSPLRDTTPAEDSSGIPDSARLLDEIDLEPPTPEALAGRWQHGPTTDAVVGAGYDGPFHLDLRRDGPHALVAGTTGSGKSEFLQTMVASLAIANRPDQLTFVLVDYKGGSAFKDCARLPHTVGMVTDLDNHLVSRALVSLGAELHRREHLLSVPGAKDLEDYWALQASDPSLPAIPRLVLVIDEFASLAAELPDFVEGLVSIAQRGRSLGIHLVLATQRPSGVVSADIRANTNLRICLRVTDEADSEDVIDSKEAALIGAHQPGRAYLRSGASTLLPFQSGRVGGARPDATATPTVVEAMAWPRPWGQAGLPAPQRPKGEGRQTDEGETDLSVLVDTITTVNTGLGIPEQHRPWLDALPGTVLLDDLPEPGVEPAFPDAPPAVGWALADLPDSQEQRALTFQLGREGHLYVVGGPRSGRSTALRTLAAALARHVAARDLHVYGLDCGNGALLGLNALPHTGAVASRTQVDRIDRLLNRLVALVEERQGRLGAQGYADLAELRAALPADERPPYVLVLLDRWDGFMSSLGELDGGRLTDQVQALLRDGAAAGVHVVISGDRTLVSGRMATMVENRVVLRLADRGDFGTVGISPKEVPDTMPDGRALMPDPTVELQVAVLGPDLSGQGQNAAVREIVEANAARDADVPAALRPFRMDELPTMVAWSDEIERALAEAAEPLSAGMVPIAIGGDDLTLQSLDLSGAATAVVAGPPKSGRTTTLRFVARAARAAGLPVLGLGPTRNPLLEDLGDGGLLADEVGEDDLVERLRGLEPGAVVLLDDAEMMKNGPLSDALDALMDQARGKGLRVVMAGSAADLGSGYSGWIYEARKSRQGLLLSPQDLADGEIYSTRIKRSMLMPKVVPGRGLLVTAGGEQAWAQVPRL